MKGLPHTKKPCSNCPFRKDSLKGWLGKVRMERILEADSFVCHKKTDLQCSGHMHLKGNENIFQRLANAMGINLKLKGKDLIFDNKQDCINHHTNQY